MQSACSYLCEFSNVFPKDLYDLYEKLGAEYIDIEEHPFINIYSVLKIQLIFANRCALQLYYADMIKPKSNSTSRV